MNIPEIYQYLVRARRDLWESLQSVPDEVLSRHLLKGPRFHCIKDLVFHIPDVEDGWIHGDILREPTVQCRFPALRDASAGVDLDLEMLLDYWRAVEEATLAWLPTLTDTALQQVITLEDSPDERYTVDGLLWHVMIHEMRHTAQIAVLLRTQGIDPPSLDLLFYLPSA